MAPALLARRIWRELQAAKAGMPEEERDKVTGRFYRVDASRQQRGSGLGLSLVQAIADYHKTELTLSDNAPGLRVEVAFNR